MVAGRVLGLLVQPAVEGLRAVGEVRAAGHRAEHGQRDQPGHLVRSAALRPSRSWCSSTSCRKTAAAGVSSRPARSRRRRSARVRRGCRRGAGATLPARCRWPGPPPGSAGTRSSTPPRCAGRRIPRRSAPRRPVRPRRPGPAYRRPGRPGRRRRAARPATAPSPVQSGGDHRGQQQAGGGPQPGRHGPGVRPDGLLQLGRSGQVPVDDVGRRGAAQPGGVPGGRPAGSRCRRAAGTAICAKTVRPHRRTL
jgi:hypothetical protein